MNFKLKTKPAKKPLTLDEAKGQLNIELDDTTDDEYIKTLISVATQQVEQFLGRRLITQTWYLYLDGWWYKTLTMPFGRLQSVTSISYKDTDGNSTVWSSDDYIVNSDSDPGEIVLGYEKSFPTETLYPSNPVIIEFVCGYGLSGSDVEPNILHAMKLMLTDFYENRGTQEIIGGSATFVQLPTARYLLTPFRIFRHGKNG